PADADPVAQEGRSACVVGYIAGQGTASGDGGQILEIYRMKVSDILLLKGSTLYVAQADDALADAVALMAEKDIGSLVVMEHGDVVGMLTFREVIQATVKNG